MSGPSTQAIFLSYAREDLFAALRIAEALRSHEVEVWFDQNELRGADTWDTKIRLQINECSLFVPIISSNTDKRSKGYFRLEWKLAVEQTHLLAEGVPFIAPVVIDETRESSAIVPPEFLRVQWIRLPGALPTPHFVAQMKRLRDAPRTGAQSRRPFPAITQAGAGAAPRPTKRPAALAVAAVMVILLGVAAYFGLRPSPESRNNPRLEAAAAPGQSSSVAARPAAKSVAVLAFVNLSDDKENEYFCDGISEELLNVLAKVTGLRVAARTSAFSFKGKNQPIQLIARELGVAYVVEGSVQKSGGRVKITAQLINAADGFHLWSDTFMREPKDIFAVQDEIAGIIAQNLQLKLGDAARRITTVNPEAHRLVLEGRHFWSLRTDEGYQRAEAAFVKAIEIDPRFAQAHAGLADVCLIRGAYQLLDGFNQPDVATEVQRARTEAQRAIELDPALAEAYPALAYVEMLEARWGEAERLFQKALSLNPNYALARGWLANLRVSQGRLDEALREFERSVELDPLWVFNLGTYAETLALAGRFRESLAITDRVMALRKEPLLPNLGTRGRALLALGRPAEAVETARVIRHGLTVVVRRHADTSAAWIFERAGFRGENAGYAEDVFKQLPPLSHQRGSMLAALGRFDEALPFLERLPPRVQHRLYLDPIWDPWREDPRFQQLLVKLKCVEEYNVARATLARMLKEYQSPGASGPKSAPNLAPPK